MKTDQVRLILCTCLAVLLFTSAALAQSPMATPSPSPSPSQRDVEKQSLYTRYFRAMRSEIAEQQQLAYELAQQYLQLYGNDNDKYVSGVRNYVVAYEKLLRESELSKTFAAKNYLKVFEDANLMLAADPENYFLLSMLAQAGYELSRTDASRNQQTVEHARHALRLLESGKVKETDPFKDVDSAKGFLNYAIGWLLRTDSPAESAAALRQSATVNSPFKIDPGVYSLLGALIIKGEYLPKAKEYNEKFGSKPPSPEQNTALAELKQIGARAIDAYARAVALSTTPQQRESKATLLNQLTALYKTFNNNSDAGLNELIAGVLAKPIP
jgi:hypothetical protein